MPHEVATTSSGLLRAESKLDRFLESSLVDLRLRPALPSSSFPQRSRRSKDRDSSLHTVTDGSVSPTHAGSSLQPCDGVKVRVSQSPGPKRLPADFNGSGLFKSSKDVACKRADAHQQQRRSRRFPTGRSFSIGGDFCPSVATPVPIRLSTSSQLGPTRPKIPVRNGVRTFTTSLRGADGMLWGPRVSRRPDEIGRCVGTASLGRRGAPRSGASTVLRWLRSPRDD